MFVSSVCFSNPETAREDHASPPSERFSRPALFPPAATFDSPRVVHARGMVSHSFQFLEEYLSQTLFQSRDIDPDTFREACRLAKQQSMSLADALLATPPTSLREGLARASEIFSLRPEIDRLRIRSDCFRNGWIPEKNLNTQLPFINNAFTVMVGLEDLLSRLMLLERDAAGVLGDDLADAPESLLALTELFIAKKSSAAALEMAFNLVDPMPHRDEIPRSVSQATPQDPITTETVLRRRLIDLVRISGQTNLLEELALLTEADGVDPLARLLAARCIEQFGVPQLARLTQPVEVPQSTVTARRIATAIERVRPSLPPSLQTDASSLALRLQSKAVQGAAPSETMRVMGIHFQRGDWILLREATPFTVASSLHPQCYHRIALVAHEAGTDGLGRLVVIDHTNNRLGVQVSSLDNWIAFVQEHTIAWCVLRPVDALLSQMIEQSALSLAVVRSSARESNERSSVFQDRSCFSSGLAVTRSALAATGVNPAIFFPLQESSPEGILGDNLKRLGVDLPDSFCSPTGLLLSKACIPIAMKIQAFDSRCGIRSAVFEYFDRSLCTRVVDSLSEHSGSKTITLFLNEVADRAVAAFDTAILAIVESDDPDAAPPTDAQSESLRLYSHLVEQWGQQQLSLAQLREEVSQHVVADAIRTLDRKFFSNP